MEPGSGQTIGFIDTGIDTRHPVFAGKTVTEEFFSGATDEDGSVSSHGTAVASVAVGRPSAEYAADPPTGVVAPRGVARGADVAMFALSAGSGGGQYVPISLTGLNGARQRWAGRLNQVINWNSGTIDFVNLSVGFPGIIEQYSQQQLRDNFGAAIAALAQPGAQDKTVFVWSAGNAHGKPCDVSDFADNQDLCVNEKVNAKSVSVLSGLPARIPELRGHHIAAVAVAPDTDGDGDYDIASFSNRCGIAADWCIAAPGQSVRTAYFGPDPNDTGGMLTGARGAITLSGTSFAAPMVVGGLAVLKHFFRDQLSNTALVSRLLSTANKQGIYAERSIYGQGLMDLGAATTPVGGASVILGGTVGGPGGALGLFQAGDALGNGLARALAGREIVAFDALGAPFWFQLGEFAGKAPRPSPAMRLRDFMTPAGAGRPWPGAAAGDAPPGAYPLRLGLLRAPSFGNGGGHLLSLAGRALSLGAVTQNGLNFAVFSNQGMNGPAPTSGVALSWRPPESPFGFKGGFLSERETMLGSSSNGAFGQVSGSSVFAGIDGVAGFGSWQFRAEAEIGAAFPVARDGVFDRISPLVTSAFALRAEKLLARGGALSVSLTQPVRVGTGRARLSVPVGRTRQGRILSQSFTAGLEPTGRQLDLAVQWRRALGDDGELRLGCGWTWQPGHDAAAAPSYTLLAGWRRRF